MTRETASEDSGGRIRSRNRRKLVWGLLAASAALSTVFFAHSVVTAQAIDFYGLRPPYRESASEAPPAQTYRDWEGTAVSEVASRSVQAQLREVEGVAAPGYLRVGVHVRDEFGRPLPKEQVTVVWRSGAERTVETCITDGQGDASLLHWVKASDQGSVVLVTAWAEGPDWTAGTYAWFVPR